MTLTLDVVNEMDSPHFIATFGDVFEHAPWVAERAWHMRPFATVTALHQAMFNAVRGLAPLERIGFFNGHPDLGGQMPAALAMTPLSIAEQGGLDLDHLGGARAIQFRESNRAYRARFGFPFILCARRHTHASMLHQLARRLHRDLATERRAAMDEVFWITRLRLIARVTGPGIPSAHGQLAAQVRDHMTGEPAAKMPMVLSEIDADTVRPIVCATTNKDGYTDPPLISCEPLRIGHYELRFDVRQHSAGGAPRGADPPYQDFIPIRFGIAEPESQYHIKLLLSPWGYTTCREKDHSDV